MLVNGLSIVSFNFAFKPAQMNKSICLATGVFLSLHSFSQNTFKALVKEKESNEALPGVTVSADSLLLNGVTNDSGLIVFTRLPEGSYRFHFYSVGHKPQSVFVQLPDTTTLTVFLQREEKTLEDVTVISTTRNNQRIENAPLKVEVLGKEEMDEENAIRPANIASILGDVSGIQIQQSSAVSGNANIRIQGLEGRYTQILRDGMPLFEGFSGSFGVLSIPPLDLRQIELVKGSASTLYGGGAIGGLINLISKRPAANQELLLTLNQTTLKESDANVYASKKYKGAGYTFFGGLTYQKPVDVNKDGLTDLPRLATAIIHPRLFFYPNDKTVIIAGYGGTFEKRKGGDWELINGAGSSQHPFFEENKTARHTGELIAERNLPQGGKAILKASLSNFDRVIQTNTHYFKGAQLNYYTEASVFLPKKHWDWVLGLNMQGDRFRKKPSDPVLLQNFSNTTVGGFVQNTWRLPANTLLETGLRVDRHARYGTFVLPRTALFHRFSQQWASRLGFGMGYKTPNALAPQNVDYPIEKITPIGAAVDAEVSYGFNAEVNFKQPLGAGRSVFVNQAFFLTRLASPIVAAQMPSGDVVFANQPKPILSKGLDTYLQLNLRDWEIYAGYTFTIAERTYLQHNRFMPLTPKNRLAFTLVKEVKEHWRLGLEGSYTGPQYRDDDPRTPGYFLPRPWCKETWGAMWRWC